MTEYKVELTTVQSPDYRHQSMPSHVNYLNDEPPEGTIRLDRKNGRTEIFETFRGREVMSKPIEVTKIWHWDPQADEPLDKPQEESMKQMGPAAYLQWLIREYQVTFNYMPQTEHDCRRAARIVVRQIPAYEGEKFIQ